MWASDPWQDASYCWVVICKNAKAHRDTNVLFGHKIPLAETDAFENLPVSGPFLVQCDECHAEQSYDPTEVVRLEMSVPEGFATHLRFK